MSNKAETMKHITKGKVPLLVVNKLPGATNFEVRGNRIYFDGEEKFICGSFVLPEGRWRILTTSAKNPTEEEAGKVVEESPSYPSLYRNYAKIGVSSEEDCCNTKAESFKSIMIAEGVPLYNPYKKPNPLTCYDFEYHTEFLRWQEAQSNLWSDAVVLVGEII